MDSTRLLHTNVHVESTPPGPRATADRGAIPGWGVDLDHADRPAYPKERTPPRLPEHSHQHIFAAQPQTLEVLLSTERPGITPVFGTGPAPSGLSGALRRLAFRYSENDLRHWLILLFADRLNVGEGLASDLVHGHLPNIYAEMGGPAEVRYNGGRAIKKAAVIGVVALIAVVYFARRD